MKTPLSQTTFGILMVLILFGAAPRTLVAGVEDLDALEGNLRMNREGRALTLDEAVRLAILRSLDIKVLDLDQKSKAFETMKAKGIFDSSFRASFDYLHDSKQNTSRVLGSREITSGFDLALEKKLPTGTDVTFSMENERNSTDSSFSTLNPTFTALSKVHVTQSLLKNGFGYLDRSEVKLVAIDVERFSYETQDRIEEAITTVIEAYWELAVKIDAFEARVEAFNQAKKFWEIMTDKFSFGMAEKPDLNAAEANLRNRMSDALVARYKLESQVSEIRVLLDLPAQEWLLLSQQPELGEIIGSLDQSLATAFERRRDYEQVKLDVESSRITLKMKKNSRWPELDLEASYASNALDLSPVDAAGEAFEAKYPTYFAGVTLTIPLENRDAKAEYKQAVLERQKKLIELKKLEREIYRSVDQSWRGLLVSYERAKQSLKVETLQLEKLEEEAKHFQQGRSSSKVMIDYQDDFIDARLQAIEDLVAFEQAKIELLRSQNTLLDHLGISPA
jgi:outer membrane protein